MNLDSTIQEARIRFWNRLLLGEPVRQEELDHELLAETQSCGDEARVALTLLRACVALQTEGSEATRRSLRTALYFWFSNSGSAMGEQAFCANDACDVLGLMGRALTWREAASLTGSNPNDYSAYKRLVAKLKDEYTRHSELLFGVTPAAVEE